MDLALPSGRTGSLVALAITLLLVLVLWLGLVAPVVSFYGDRAEHLAHDQALLERMERLAASLPTLRKQVAEMREDGESRVFTIEGGSDAVAAATLQDMVQDMATSVNANITSFETVPGQQVGAYRRIGLKVSLHEPWTVVVALIKTVETARLPMLIDELEIHALPALNAVNGQRLEASFTIYAFRAGPGGEAK
ncbi:MAG TPA: type II secretion system protein GspM [Stellaceae bacterium]|nr:type II secretion system protein GspM [Stellaceae bacterium]